MTRNPKSQPRLIVNSSVFIAGLLAGTVIPAPEVTAGERAALDSQVFELTRRVAALEREQGTPSRVTAPFVVIGSDGKALFQVVDNVGQAAWARVTMGGSGSGHSVVAVSSDGKPGGAGAVLSAEPDGRGALTIRNAKGDPIVRAAESGTGDGILAVQDRGNRGLFLVTPNFAAAQWARVTVGAGAGSTSAIMVSQDGKPGGAGVLISAESGTNPGNVAIRGSAGNTLAVMSANDGGLFVVRDRTEKTRIRLDPNGVNVYGPSDNAVVTLGADSQRGNAGSLTLMTPGGKLVAAMRGTPDGNAGTISVMNSTGKAVAGLTGGAASGGAVVVNSAGGVGLAQMSVTDDGRGLVQVFGAGQRPIAVLTQKPETGGGLLQISNTGYPVANLTVGGQGAGYLQLTDPSGNPTVEAGTLSDGLGTVRAGPTYQCLPVTLSGPISFVPNCIMGNRKK